MSLRRTIHVVFAVTLSAILPLKEGLAATSLIEADHAEAIYRHLVECHWTPRTGLFRSFPDSRDLKLSQQASTYEQAAMGLLCIRMGDLDRAEGILRFYKEAWNTKRGLANFYNAYFNTEGVEKTVHTGPNAWIGLFAAKLANTTKDPETLQFALDIQYWIANIVPHNRGGVAMGPHDDPYGAAWTQIYSTENNLSYYAFLTELLRSTRLDYLKRDDITRERDRVENWLVNVAYDRKTGRIFRGTNAQGLDHMAALDTVTWFISAVGPRRLAMRGIDPDKLMLHTATMFEVAVGGHSGIDAADQEEADQTYNDLKFHPEDINRPAGDHHRVIWYEGLGQYILAWTNLADEANRQGAHQKAEIYLQRAKALAQEFDQAALKNFPAGSAYPYATPGKFFRYGWGAPQPSNEGPASSLIAGIWRCFAGLGFDPVLGRDLGVVYHPRITLPKDFTLASDQTPILYGTSEDMTTEAWKALNAKDWDRAIAQAQATIQEWAGAAMFLEQKKRQEVGHLLDFSGDPNEKKEIFKYWALNDVAAAYFILGEAQDHKGNYANASRAFQQIVTHYPLAQVWDPHGWFWSPVEAITNDYVLRDRAHYGWVFPEALAEGSRVGKQPF